MSAPPTPPLPVVQAAQLEDERAGRPWLVETLWTRAGVGIIGGAPKLGKSWLGLDLALSVASGTPCLDVFAVPEPGPVLLHMAEDAAPAIKQRLRGLCRHRGLDLAALPLFVITAPALRLDLDADQQRLHHTLAHRRPRLLLLDPFVRLHRIDENHSGDVAGILAYLRQLQRTFELAVIVVHHTRKNARPGAAGQNLRGSGDFHAWYDSSLHLHRHQDTIVLTPEHRSAAPPAPVHLRLHTGEGADDTCLQVVDPPETRAQGAPAVETEVLQALAAGPLTREQLRATLRIRNQRLGSVLHRLAQDGRVVRQEHAWAVPIPAPTLRRERNGQPKDEQLSLMAPL
jgi:hypothetical protein